MKVDMESALVTRWLGRVSFREALELQEEIVSRKRRHPHVADELLLLEHEPVYTIGRTPDQSSLRGAKHLPHPLYEINRGGQATYHGPGQLVGYFLLDLRRYGQDLHRYLRWIETVLIDLLGQFDIATATREGLTGIWVENPETTGSGRKIASIGVGVRHWITMHGFALNVSGDLTPFDHITPCGITGVTMTSIEKETDVALPVQDVGIRIAGVARERIANLVAGSTTVKSWTPC